MEILIALTVIGCVFMYILCETSSYGYEDENGFHPGQPPIDEE